MLPFIEYDDLEPEMAGIRPKLQGPGEDVKDFVIRDESDRGLPGFVNLIGIESPGLTSSLAIARYVAGIVRDIL
jgi:L-2-hydroxyglutarate oxidase LhgO